MNEEKVNRFKSKILDIRKSEVYPAEILIENGYFKKVTPLTSDSINDFGLDFEGIVVPGFIDAHIHIESSLLTPTNFAKAVVPFGTTSVIADPHEIANVCGMEGIEFMIEDGKRVPFDFYFSAPTCVPATEFETSGACIDSVAIEKLMKKDEIIALGEVMNYVGVINQDKEIITKLEIAKKYKKPIDGHAPGLSGDDLEKYINMSISTDHECVSFDEAIEKKELGMKIMVREGSSAKNMEALLNIKDRINLHSKQDFFHSVSVYDFENVLKNPIFDFLVTDDKESKDLKHGHLNILIKKAIGLGIDPIEAIKMVTINPAIHYNLNSGEIANDKIANFVIIDNFDDFNIKKTFIHGKLVAEDGKTLFNPKKPFLKNTFKLNKTIASDFDIKIENNKSDLVTVNVIEVMNNEITTKKFKANLKVEDQVIQANLKEDILKLAVVERYGNNNIANAFVKGFNLKKGAIASSVAHDSHNIIVLGTDSEDMTKAVNLISENKGGLAIVNGKFEKILKLPIAGLMSDKDLATVSRELEEINKIATDFGCKMESPFMTLSFLALLVIPSIRLSDKGLFDVDEFSFIDVYSV
ncbi:MAG: adenine deaminase [Methanobacteriaceae archaeon]|jgi:adenine deaminase|nr:adenine deaminase [Candidatus Methanorudis spinitermitis]